MALTSFPFETTDTTETQYSRLFSEFQESGVCDSIWGDAFRVTAPNGLEIQVQPGAALLRGFMVISDAVETLTATATPSQVRYDRVVLRLDPTANTITLRILTGTPGSNVPPAWATSPTDTFEIPLAMLEVTPSAKVTVTDERNHMGMRIMPVTNWTIPPASEVRRGQLVYNADSNSFLYSNGSTWTALIPSLVDQSTRWGPGTGYALIVQTETPPVTPNTIWIKPA